MVFNSLEYAFLFLTAFAGAWLLARHIRLRMLFLLVVSYVFYASWAPTYLLLIVLSSTVDYITGRTIHRTSRSIHRKGLLTLSLVVNLGILCIFKYFNFFATEFTALLGVFGFEARPIHLRVLLPVGISFYTFQSLSYTIDIYRRQMKPAQHYYQYLLYVAFFPQLVAGPIVRARHLLSQFLTPPRLTAEDAGRAALLIGLGLVKKIAIADYLGTHLVDPVFSNPQMFSALENLAAVWGYAFQIYADFSAYSDIAIGSAALLGFQIPINFNAPYTAADLRDFWQRWHISLSTWLRDYLYIPLGGSRKGPVRTSLNLAITMFLGGLWHGAALTFVLWGVLHGVALIATRILQRTALLSRIPRHVRRWLGVFCTFHLVCVAWVFFRAPNLETAWQIFSSLRALDATTANLSIPGVLVLTAAAITHWIPNRWMDWLITRFSRLPSPLQALILVAMITAAVHLARSTDVAPFIYFQF